MCVRSFVPRLIWHPVRLPVQCGLTVSVFGRKAGYSGPGAVQQEFCRHLAIRYGEESVFYSTAL